MFFFIFNLNYSMPLIDFFILLLGLFLVVKGADLLLSSAIAIGKKYKISDFFIGLAIVGFWNISSELLVSIEAILKNLLIICWKCNWF